MANFTKKVAIATVLFVLLSVTVNLGLFSSPRDRTAGKGVTWALLVAGSDSFFDLRHQADICAAYHILKRGGLNDKHVIIMMYHSLTISTSKPPSARLMRGYWSFHDLCKSVPKHYTGSDVSPRNLVAVLTGDETAVGGRKVIKANMNDHLFVYFAGHEDKDVLIMPSDYLLKSHLVEALAKIDKQKKFQSMVVYLSACHSACRFEDYKFDNMYMIASAKSEEGSMSTFLYTIFGRAWIMYSASHYTNITTVGSEFEHLKTFGRFFNVTEIGNVSLKANTLSMYHGHQYQGYHYPLEMMYIKEGSGDFYVKDLVLMKETVGGILWITCRPPQQPA